MARRAAAAADSAAATADTTTASAATAAAAATTLSGRTALAPAGGRQSSPDKRHRTTPSRSARLVQIRRKMESLGTQQRQPDAASSAEIELVCMNVTSLAEAASAHLVVNAKDHVEASTSPQRRGRFAVVSIQFALVLAGILWALSDIAMTQREGIEYFIKLDCNRIGSFRPAAVLVMTGFFLTAIHLRPKKNVVSSIAHRALFANVGIFLVCAYAVVAAFIGYPQGLCENRTRTTYDSCTCGMCVALGAPERGPDADFQRMPHVQREKLGIRPRPTAQTFRLGENGEGVEPAIICSMKSEQPRGNKIVVGTNFSGKIAASTLGATINMMTEYLKRVPGGENYINSVPKPDESCKKTPQIKCPDTEPKKKEFGVELLLPFMPIVCDNFYGYCDKSNALRRACPETTCCRICDQIFSLSKCDEKTKSYMDSKLDIFGGDLVSKMRHIDQAGIPSAFMDELQTMMAWYLRTFTFLRNESMADGVHYNKTACKEQCKEQARQAQWYGHDSDCLPNAERSWDLNDTKKGKGPRNETANGEASREETCICDARARAWSESVVIWQGIAGACSVAFVALQNWVALQRDDEGLMVAFDTLALRPAAIAVVMMWGEPNNLRHTVALLKEQFLTAAVCIFLIICLVRQLDVIVSASPGTSCFSQESYLLSTMDVRDVENANLMKSWLLLHITMVYIIFEVFVMSVIKWLLRRVLALAEAKEGVISDSDESIVNTPARPAPVRPENQHACRRLALWKCSETSRRCFDLKTDLGAAFDDMFSFERGRWYMYLVLVLEIVEVVNQASQLISFSHERPYQWIVTLSGLLVLNGLCAPAPSCSEDGCQVVKRKRSCCLPERTLRSM